MRNILITGGAGFIGSNLAERLSSLPAGSPLSPYAVILNAVKDPCIRSSAEDTSNA